MFILVFIITLLILVLIHEFGHFIMAKKFGIKVLEFGFGIPPRIFGKKFGETIYSMNWLPFGGFVRLLGEDEPAPLTESDGGEKSRYFSNRPVWQRVVVVLAGVFMNLILAWIIFWIVIVGQNFKVQLPLLLDYNFIGAQESIENMIVVSAVAEDSPAQESGIKSGDRVLAADDKFIKNSNDLVSLARSKAGGKIKLTLSDLAQTSYKTIEVAPRENPPDGQGPLGIALGSFEVVNLKYETILQKIFSAPTYSINLAGYNIKILSKLISTAVLKNDLTPISQSVAGPIGITNIVREVLEIKNPLIPYLNFLAVLSLNLTIVNVLPFPGLDGGRLLFLVIEGITRKRLHSTIEKYVHTVGLAILLTLIVLITVSDLRKIL